MDATSVPGPEGETGKQPPARCGQCGSEQMHETQVRSAFWHGERLVVVEDIPAVVCGVCREQFYDDATVVLLDLLRGEGFPEDKAQGELTVPVFSLRGRLPAGDGS